MQLATDAETLAAPELMTPDFAIVNLGLIRLEVQIQRLQIVAPASSSSRVRELASGVLETLEHLPVNAIGMNRHTHFRAPNDLAWHAVGNKLVPKSIWSDMMDSPGMKSVSVDGKRPGQSSGGVTVAVQPSERVRPGVLITVNEHHQIASNQTTDVIQNLTNWDEIQRYARDFGEELLKRCLES
jgi:hypothetical protein